MVLTSFGSFGRGRKKDKAVPFDTPTEFLFFHVRFLSSGGFRILETLISRIRSQKTFTEISSNTPSKGRETSFSELL